MKRFARAVLFVVGLVVIAYGWHVTTYTPPIVIEFTLPENKGTWV